MLLLRLFNIELKDKKGHANVVVDDLSRIVPVESIFSSVNIAAAYPDDYLQY